MLSDPEKRAAYDRYGHAAFQNGGGGGNPFTGGGFGGAQDLGDIFGDLFGEMFNMGGNGGRKASRVQRGRDLRYDLTLEFEEAVFGKEKEITIRRMETCTDCKGSGAARGQGCGDVYAVRRARAAEIPAGILFGGADLHGVRRHGDVDRRSVHRRAGARRGCRREHTILVKVPAGVEQDTRIRYRGEGEAGKFAGPAGDLYVVLNVKAHKFFERDGDDLHCVMPISFPQAALGTELEIQTLEGPASIKVPEGTQSGKTFKLRGQGRAASELAWEGRFDCGDSGADAIEAEQAAEGVAAAVERDDGGGEYADFAWAV